MDRGNCENEKPKQIQEKIHKTRKEIIKKAGSVGITVMTLGSSLFSGCSATDISPQQPITPISSEHTRSNEGAKNRPNQNKDLELVNKQFKNRVEEKYGICPEISYLQAIDSSIVSKSEKGSTLKFAYDTYPGILTKEEMTEIEYAFEKVPYFGQFIKTLQIDILPKTTTDLASISEYRITGTWDNKGLILNIGIPEDFDLESEITKGWVEKLGIKLEDPVVWKTNKEDLRHVPIHEAGHAIAQAMLKITTGDEMAYRKEGVEFPESTNPLYKKFAEIEGMKLNGLHYENPGKDDRITERYAWSVQEYFAEMFAVSRLKPELLKPEEAEFFNELHNGLLKKGIDYLKTLN